MRLLLLIFVLLGSQLSAQTTLIDRKVEFGILTFDDPNEPLFDGLRHNAIVGNWVEFDLGREGAQNNIDVVPVQVDISNERIEVFIPNETGNGQFWGAKFNGYVLTFPAECTVVEGASLVRAETTLAKMGSDFVTFSGQAVFINLSGLFYKPGDLITVHVDVADCLIG